MPKKPQTEHIGPSSPKEYDEMAAKLARMQAAGRQGKSPRDDNAAKRALLIERFDQQQQKIKQEIEKAEAKKAAYGIREQLQAALKSLSPRRSPQQTPRSPQNKDQGRGRGG